MDVAYFNYLILDIQREAGRIAMELQAGIKPTIKDDKSVVTEADLRITAMVKEKLADVLKDPRHILIDEESEADLPPPNDPIYKEKEFIWVLDPVDGTATYAHGMPLYGTILGIFRNGKPWLGSCYLPALGELFLHDGTQATFTKNPINRISTTHVIEDTPLPKPHADSVYFIDPPFMNNMRPGNNPCIVVNPYAAAIFNSWPAIGRARGATFRAKLWDLAGCWPILTAAGFKLINMRTGIEAKTFFDMPFDENWRVKDPHMVTHPSDEAHFKKILEQIG